MIIESEQASGCCDVCQSHPATHAVVTQGATGRWCEVMWLCKSDAVQMARNEQSILTRGQALHYVERTSGWADF